MDGVLIDSEPAHKLAKERAFAKFGIVLPEAVYERYKLSRGRGLTCILSAMAWLRQLRA
jgi:beta-phosphoglucomutase-like phosphatase (HAD superfamily)